MNKFFRYGDKFPWGPIGVAATAVGILLSLYFWLKPISSDDPSIATSVVSESKVFDVLTPVESLQVIYRGLDISKARKNLRFLTVEVANSGKVDVLQDMYDENNPWGFVLEHGTIISKRTDTASSNYLKSSLDSLKPHNDTVYFGRPIFERGEYFRTTLLVIHSEDTLPTIRTIGKIARFRSFPVVYQTQDRHSEPRSFFWRVIHGSDRFLQFMFFLQVTLLAYAGTRAAFVYRRIVKRSREQ